MTHTPGIWKSDDRGVIWSDRHASPIARDVMVNDRPLITLAPILLAALGECADRLETCARCGGNDREIAASAVKVYRDLISKAEAA